MAKKLHVGSLDSVKGFKNLSLDLKTYEEIFDLSQNNPMGVDLSVAKTIKFLLTYYKREEEKKLCDVKPTENIQVSKPAKQKKLIKI